MLVYQIPYTSFQRLFLNDTSGNFKIIVEMRYNKKQDDNIAIEETNKIVVNTTVNKARIISKVIDEKYKNNPNIKQYVFNLGNMFQDGNHEQLFEDIIHIFHAIVESNGNYISIPNDKKNLFDKIREVLENESNIDNNITECQYSGNKIFNGIISYIKQNTNDIVDGNNDHLRLNGTGNIPQFPLSNILLYSDLDYLKTYINCRDSGTVYSESDAEIEFDFVNRKINMTSYSIRTSYNPVNSLHPKTWKFVGSNDKKNWEMIDIKENNARLNGPSFSSHFACSNPGKFYRYIKYIQIDNWKNAHQTSFRYYVGLSAIEFFGYIKTE